MPSYYTIAAVERSTGISRETLRIWERRYGFPLPERDEQGDRRYSQADLDRLRQIKRLLDQGFRPRAVVPPHSGPSAADRSGHAATPAFEEFLALLRAPEVDQAQAWLRRRLARTAVSHFVLDTLSPLVTEVGDAWAEGRLCVHEEHLFSALVARLLHRAIDAMPAGKGPRVLLTTLPGEQHGLALLMAEALLRAEGARCINLGVDTPLPETILAAAGHRADVLALSISAAYPRRRIGPQLESLREQLPAHCAIWVGGNIHVRLPALAGLRKCADLATLSVLLAELRQAEMG